jgi:hypothetical protein
VADPKKRGRPSKVAVEVEFTLDSSQAAHLLEMADRFGWGETVHSAAKALVVSRVTAFQEASALAHPWELSKPD